MSTESDQRRLADDGAAKVKELLAGLTVTDIQVVTHAKRLDNMKEAPSEACRTCPWRRDNAGAEDRLLSEENLTDLWDKVTRGVALACHKTVVNEAVLTDEDRARGWAMPPDSVTPRECAGALAQVVKEEGLRDELGSNEAYLKVRGTRAMTPEGFERLARRRAGVADAPPIRESRNPDLYGRPWIPDPVGANSLPVVPPCFCPVCQRHEEVHTQVAVTPPGSEAPIDVDAALAPMLEALWAAGAITLASCEDMRGAVSQLLGEEDLTRLESPGPPVSTYRWVVLNGLAFVRGVYSPVWEPVAERVRRLDDGQVLRRGPGIQLAFPLADMPRLLEAL